MSRMKERKCSDREEREQVNIQMIISDQGRSLPGSTEYPEKN